jgi:hypothetical protein
MIQLDDFLKINPLGLSPKKVHARRVWTRDSPFHQKPARIYVAN